MSEKNLFLHNLTESQEEEITNDFKFLFSSRRIEAEPDLYAMDEELAREFLLILN